MLRLHKEDRQIGFKNLYKAFTMIDPEGALKFANEILDDKKRAAAYEKIFASTQLAYQKK